MVEIKEILGAKEIPLLNEPFLIGGASIYSTVTPTKKVFMEFFKKSPEAIGIINKIVKDINSTVHFRTMKKEGKKGRPNKDLNTQFESRAERFAKENYFKRELGSALLDWLVTGEFFVWMGQTKSDTIRLKMAKLKALTDEDYSDVNFIRTVASTTCQPFFSATEVYKYKQEVNNLKREWSPNEIIHGTFMNLDGKVNGFTPFRASYSIIQTLGLIKDYCGNFFAGGGVPDIVFSLPDENMESPSFKRIQQVIQEYSNAQRTGLQKRGHIVFAGKLQVDKLNEFNKEMEFRQLLLTYVGIMAFTFQLPASSLKAILGGEVKESAGGTDVSEGGYWRTIKDSQEYIEELFNSQLWRPFFNVEMYFGKKYLIDEIKESQNYLILGDVTAKQNFVLQPYGKKINEATVLQRFGLKKEELEELTPEEKKAFKDQQNPPDYRQGQPDKTETNRGEATEQYRKAKKDEQDKKV